MLFASEGERCLDCGLHQKGLFSFRTEMASNTKSLVKNTKEERNKEERRKDLKIFSENPSV